MRLSGILASRKVLKWMMNLVARWPIRPEPLPYESLSSWLNRTALIYQVSVAELLASVCAGDLPSQQEIAKFDLFASTKFLQRLSRRSGLPVARLRQMTLAHWVAPLRSLHQAKPAPTFAQYVRGFRVFDWPINLNSPAMVPAVAWSVVKRGGLECPECVAGSPTSYERLTSAFCLIGSCPLHGCECASPGFPSSRVMGRRPADAITLEILTTGKGTLPSGQEIGADWWFRFLRSLLCELEQHPGFRFPLSPANEVAFQVWRRAGVTLPRYLEPFEFFEVEGLTRRKDLLSLANVAVDMLLRGELRFLERSSFLRGGELAIAV